MLEVSRKLPRFPLWVIDVYYHITWLSDRVCSIRWAYRLFHRPSANTSVRVHRQFVGLLQVSAAAHVWLANVQDLSHESLAQVWSLHRPTAWTRTKVRREGIPYTKTTLVLIWLNERFCMYLIYMRCTPSAPHNRCFAFFLCTVFVFVY